MFLWLCSSPTNYQTSLLLNHGRKSIGDGGEDEGKPRCLSEREQIMDLSACCLPDTLDRGRAGVSSRQPSEDRPCDLTVRVKESLIVFGNVLFIRWRLVGGGAAYLCFWCAGKQSLSDNIIQNVYTCVTAPFPSDPIIPALWEEEDGGICSSSLKHLLSHPGQFWCTRRQDRLPTARFFSFISVDHGRLQMYRAA